MRVSDAQQEQIVVSQEGNKGKRPVITCTLNAEDLLE
jgi:hypothetical protein